MKEQPINPDQSLELIQQMIRQTRHKVERNAGIPFIVMGYTTVLTTLAIIITYSITQDPRCHYLWFTITLVAIIGAIINRRKGRVEEVKTYVDLVLNYVWATLGGAGFMLSMISIFVQMPILFLIILLMGCGTAITGLVIRSRVVSVAGLVATFALAPLSLLTPSEYQMVVFAAAFVVMMIIPGHVLNYKTRRRV